MNPSMDKRFDAVAFKLRSNFRNILSVNCSLVVCVPLRPDYWFTFLILR